MAKLKMPFDMSPGLIGGPPKQRPMEAIVNPGRPAAKAATATKQTLAPRRNTPQRGKL